MPSDARDEQPVPGGPPERGEHEDGDDHHDSRKLVPQRGCRRENCCAFSGVSGEPGLVAGDRLVLGAVVLEHAGAGPSCARAATGSRGRSRSGSTLLDEPEQEAEPSSSLQKFARPTGSTKKRPTANAARATTVPAHVPPEICSSSSGSWALAEMPSALKPIFSDSASATTPRMTAAAARGALRPRDERERRDLDLAERGLLGVEPVLAELLGRGLADRDGPGRDAAHHHALEHRLAADGRVLLRHQGAVRQAGLGHAGLAVAQPVSRSRARRLAARRWKRSTRPPVSTSFCRPV